MTIDRNDVSQECEESVDGPDAICRRNPEQCDPDPPLDHRRHRRLQLEGPMVGVKYGSDREMRAQVQDVSSEGLCLQLEDGHGLQAGQGVRVRLDGGDWVFSLVTHSDAGHVGLWLGEPVSPEAAGLVNRLAETMR
ncbi:MAG: hypothetical protein DRQ45_03415 [Gammaproteobacteria bacterium]|nr:MAG: hypothetical protein DRQ45_03415 [Gammaproteobacteria bacterium]